MDKVMEFLPFLIPLVIAEFALLGYTLQIPQLQPITPISVEIVLCGLSSPSY